MLKKDRIYVLIIFLFSFSFFIPLFENPCVIGDDTIFHTSNIIANSSTITLKSMFPSPISPILVNNLGYGVHLFYPPLPHLIGSYLYKIVGNISTTMKILQFFSFFFAGVTMYLYVKKVFHNQVQALITSIFYMSMPYFFTDVFTRNALNESFLFGLIPIVLWSLDYLFKEHDQKRFYFYFVFGYTLCIYTHLVLAVYFTIMIIFYLCVFYRKLFTKETLKRLFLASILILVFTSRLWVPVLEHYFLNNYYIFQVDYSRDVLIQTIPFYYYLLPITFTPLGSNSLHFFVPIIVLIFWMLAFLLIYRKVVKKEHKKILLGLLIILVLSFFLSTNSTIWGIIPNLLKNIQFGWRLAIFVSFSAAVIGGYGIHFFSRRYQMYVLMFVVILFAFTNYIYSSKLPYVNGTVDYLQEECCSLQWQYEYLPKTAKTNALYLYYHDNDLVFDSEKASVKMIQNNLPDLKFEVDSLVDKVKIEFPRIFYLGYELLDEDNQKYDVYQNSFGLLEGVIERKGIYTLKYRGTLLSRIFYWIRFVTLILFFCYLLFFKKGTKKYY